MRPLVPTELPSRRPAQLAGRSNEARRRFSGRFDRAARHLRRGLGAQEAPRDAAAPLGSRLPACLGRLPRRVPDASEAALFASADPTNRSEIPSLPSHVPEFGAKQEHLHFLHAN